jgi:hypothetical protein
MPIGMPISACDDHGNAAQIDRDHRLFPKAGSGDQRRQRSGKQRQSQAAKPPAREGQQSDHAKPGQAGQRPLERHQNVEAARRSSRLPSVSKKLMLIQATASRPSSVPGREF